MASSLRFTLLLSLAVLATRLPFAPPTLEDIDSVNFALALDDFDVTRHQPHPPGSAVYVGAAKTVHFFVHDPVRALSFLSALAQALLVAPLAVLLFRLSSGSLESWTALALTLAAPILWFNGARPLSDSLGLLFVLSAQALLMEEGENALFAGAFLSGVAAGVRVQAAILTLPLWTYRFATARGHRLRLSVGLVSGVLVWAAPLVALTGGPSAYWGALVETARDAAPTEPLVMTFTVNRALRAAFHVLTGPWAQPALGLTMTALAALGSLTLLRARRRQLGLALLLYGPYLALHTLLQQTSVLRYSLPYTPFLSWLAAVGLLGISRKKFAVVGGATALVVWSSWLVLPALVEYRKTPSPPHAAMERVRLEAASRGRVVLAGHYMFHRYLGLRPDSLSLLEPRPGKELDSVTRYWLSGGTEDVLFLADPQRTGLESVNPESRLTLGRWGWSKPTERFLGGSRPDRAELIVLEKPRWFAGEGWMISDEAGSVAEVTALAERRAYLEPLAERSFLLVSGGPISPEAVDFVAQLELAGTPLDRRNLGQAWLQGYLLDPPPIETAPPLLLTVRTSRNGSPEGAPFLLKGVDYGSTREPGWVHGEGWFLPERDEERAPFRWTSPTARSLLHVPQEGARLVVEGVAPIEYLGPKPSVRIRVGGEPRASAVLDQRSFRMELTLEAADHPFQEVTLHCDRRFVPDLIQRNGDRRELSLRLYRFEVSRRVKD